METIGHCGYGIFMYCFASDEAQISIPYIKTVKKLDQEIL